MAGSGTREWGDRWSVAPIGGRCLDRPLAQAFIGGVGGGRGRGVVTSAARSDYRPPERRRRVTADCCTEPRTIRKLAGGPFRGQVDSGEEAQTAEVTCRGPAHFSDK
jgi:hypothetical protein